MDNSMIDPSIVDLLKVVNNRYSLAVIASKRAREIIDGDKVLIDIDSTKPVTIAINEINENVLTFKTEEKGKK